MLENFVKISKFLKLSSAHFQSVLVTLLTMFKDFMVTVTRQIKAEEGTRGCLAFQ